MKRVLSIFVAVVLMVSASFTVMAAPGGFISSPSGNLAPELVEFSSESEDCTATLVVTAYSDRETLPQEALEKIEKAYKEITNNVDLSKLCAGISEIAKEKNIPVARLAVSDLFDISYYDCDEHDEHGHFDITLKSESLEHFVCLLHLNGDKWEIVKDAKAEGEHLVFDIEELSPFAIVVDAGEDYVNPPQTGDNSHITLYVIVMIACVLALVVLLGKNRKKKAE